MRHPARLPLAALALLLVLGLVAIPAAVEVLPAAAADEGDAPGAMPFHERVDKALTEGVNWLHAKPLLATIPGTELPGAHWGLIKGQKLYGGGTGEQYRHPAGATALALYTLLKCGVDPDDHIIEKGFNWLRAVHRITKDADSALWDGTQPEGQEREWSHTMAGSSYELSVMVLALTAKYDAHKATEDTRKAQRAGKLKIKDRFDRAWLQQMVSGLVDRRGRPVDDAGAITSTEIKKFADPEKYKDFELPLSTALPDRKERLGWRYNAPHLDMVVSVGRSRQSWKRKVGIPPHANQDMSSTNLAALALFSAQRFGMKVPSEVWGDIVEFTLAHQEEDGPEMERHMPGFQPDRYGGTPKDKSRGFMYIKGSTDGSEGVATRSMTACGIANLLIAREMIARDDKARKAFTESGVLKQVDTGIADGLAWLDMHWSTFTNVNSKYGYHIYHLYCVERAMDILGKELIGKRLWWKPGAEEILQRQKPQDVQIPQKKGGAEAAPGMFWMTDSTHDPKDVLDTCFALLYLKRATKGLRPAVTGD